MDELTTVDISEAAVEQQISACLHYLGARMPLDSTYAMLRALRAALTASEQRVKELEQMLSCPMCDGKLGSPGACDTCMADLVWP